VIFFNNIIVLLGSYPMFAYAEALRRSSTRFLSDVCVCAYPNGDASYIYFLLIEHRRGDIRGFVRRAGRCRKKLQIITSGTFWHKITTKKWLTPFRHPSPPFRYFSHPSGMPEGGLNNYYWHLPARLTKPQSVPPHSNIFEFQIFSNGKIK